MAQTFDANSNRTQLAATIGSTADFVNAYSFDNLQHMTRIDRDGQSGGNSVAETRVNLAYNAISQFSTIARYADLAATDLAVTSTFGYDDNNRLSSLYHTQDTTDLATYDFTFDNIDRITSVDSLMDGLATYSYDITSQLTSVDFATQADEAHAWDDNGNPTGGSFSVGANNRLLSDGVYDYEYDDEGNRVRREKISDGTSREYVWDYRNRLVSVIDKDEYAVVTQEVNYVYDFLDHLISREIDPDGAGSTSATTQWFAYDGQQIVLSFDSSSATAPEYRYLTGPAIDQILAAEDSSGDVLYPLGDHQSTYRDVAEFDSGTGDTSVVNHIDFDSFHKVLNETNSAIDFAFGETGRFYDDATGLNFHNARWLDPLARRWLSEDPSTIHSGDMNFARFVGNSTPNAIDPTGLITEAEIADLVKQLGDHSFEVREKASQLLRAALTTAEDVQLLKAYAMKNAGMLDYEQLFRIQAATTNLVPLIGSLEIITPKFTGDLVGDLALGEELVKQIMQHMLDTNTMKGQVQNTIMPIDGSEAMKTFYADLTKFLGDKTNPKTTIVVSYVHKFVEGQGYVLTMTYSVEDEAIGKIIYVFE